MFFTSRQIKKMEVLKTIIESEEVSLSEISNKYNLNKRMIKILIEELESEWKNINIEKFPVIIEERQVRIIGQNDRESCLSFIFSLNTKYSSESPIFKVLRFFLEYRHTTIATMENDFNYSRSYCYKLIDKVNLTLEKMGTSLKVIRNEKKFTLIGIENEIRVVKYLVDVSPDNPYKITNTKNSFSSQIKTKKENLIDQITKKSLSNRMFLKEFNEDVMMLAPCFYEEFSFNFSHKYGCYFSIEEKNKQSTEKFFYYLLSLYFNPEMLTQEIRLKIGVNFMEVDNSLIHKSKIIINKVKDKYSLSVNQCQVLLFEIVFYYLSFTVLYEYNFHISSVEKTYKNYEIKDIQTLIYKNFKKIDNIANVNILSEYISEIIYSYIFTHKFTPIKIAINPSYKINHITIFQNVISEIYSRKELIVVSDIANADIVITNTNLVLKEFQSFYYFENIYDLSTWKHFNRFIQKKITDNKIVECLEN